MSYLGVGASELYYARYTGPSDLLSTVIPLFKLQLRDQHMVLKLKEISLGLRMFAQSSIGSY